jgi:hypothetical protein
MLHFMYCYAEYHHECHYVKCRYVECRHAECRCALETGLLINIVA